MGRAGTGKPRAVTAGAVVGLTLLLGACDGTSSVTGSHVSVTAPAAPASGLPTDLPTDLDLSPTAAPTVTVSAKATATVGVAALVGTIVPKHFPFPKGSTPRIVSSEGMTLRLELSGVTADEAVRFYRQALPAAGYKIQQQAVSDGMVKINSMGTGQTVELVASSTGNTQSVVLTFANVPQTGSVG